MLQKVLPMNPAVVRHVEPPKNNTMEAGAVAEIAKCIQQPVPIAARLLRYLLGQPVINPFIAVTAICQKDSGACARLSLYYKVL